MQPGTPHMVISLENCRADGEFFYSAATMLKSCHALIHCCIMDPAITNSDHLADTEPLLQRFWLHTFLCFQKELEASSSECSFFYA
jgi:hypothetical protein